MTSRSWAEYLEEDVPLLDDETMPLDTEIFPNISISMENVGDSQNEKEDPKSEDSKKSDSENVKTNDSMAERFDNITNDYLIVNQSMPSAMLNLTDMSDIENSKDSTEEIAKKENAAKTSMMEKQSMEFMTRTFNTIVHCVNVCNISDISEPSAMLNLTEISTISENSADPSETGATSNIAKENDSRSSDIHFSENKFSQSLPTSAPALPQIPASFCYAEYMKPLSDKKKKKKEEEIVPEVKNESSDIRSSQSLSTSAPALPQVPASFCYAELMKPLAEKKKKMEEKEIVPEMKDESSDLRFVQRSSTPVSYMLEGTGSNSDLEIMESNIQENVQETVSVLKDVQNDASTKLRSSQSLSTSAPALPQVPASFCYAEFMKPLAEKKKMEEKEIVPEMKDESSDLRFVQRCSTPVSCMLEGSGSNSDLEIMESNIQEYGQKAVPVLKDVQNDVSTNLRVSEEGSIPECSSQTQPDINRNDELQESKLDKLNSGETISSPVDVLVLEEGSIPPPECSSQTKPDINVNDELQESKLDKLNSGETISLPVDVSVLEERSIPECSSQTKPNINRDDELQESKLDILNSGKTISLPVDVLVLEESSIPECSSQTKPDANRDDELQESKLDILNSAETITVPINVQFSQELSLSALRLALQLSSYSVLETNVEGETYEGSSPKLNNAQAGKSTDLSFSPIPSTSVSALEQEPHSSSNSEFTETVLGGNKEEETASKSNNLQADESTGLRSSATVSTSLSALGQNYSECKENIFEGKEEKDTAPNNVQPDESTGLRFLPIPSTSMAAPRELQFFYYTHCLETILEDEQEEEKSPESNNVEVDEGADLRSSAILPTCETTLGQTHLSSYLEFTEAVLEEEEEEETADEWYSPIVFTCKSTLEQTHVSSYSEFAEAVSGEEEEEETAPESINLEADEFADLRLSQPPSILECAEYVNEDDYIIRCLGICVLIIIVALFVNLYLYFN